MSSNSAETNLRVVQISDSHLFAQREGELLGMCTDFSFLKVMELVKAKEATADIFLATGDIAQDGSIDAYSRFQQSMQALGKPVYYLPGNHDVLSNMQKAMDQAEGIAPCVVAHGNWRIVMLDSTVDKQVYGRFSADRLEALDRELKQSQGQHVLICLHHHPVEFGSEWLDSGRLMNGDELFEVTDKYQHVRAITWGHVHQDYEGERKGVQLFSLPSTCVQFKPRNKDFALDDLNPGYRWFDLGSDGSIKTGIERVQGIKFEVDHNSTGY